MEELMAKPMKSAKPIRPSHFREAAKPAGIKTQQVIKYFDTLPADIKRDTAAKFRDYIERQRRARKKAAQTRSRNTRGRTGTSR
jgi:hypothetical protein